ncbi:DNA adenine methylase [Roseisolibacter sp. H3M3-2]|uniref:DNA adenine methylase n=1 Tax=Roseisolibacter sp. H3M3-2 TaxID=3031323 RepID=UPI0031F31D87
MSQSEIVKPCTPAAPYLGGKRNLAKRLCAIIDATPCRTYVEPFVGMGGIFLRRSRRAPAEVINDLSGDVATLYRVLQRHYPYFIDMLKWRVTSRAEFGRLQREDASTLTDLERAARFLYLQKTAFGGKIEGRTFGIDKRSPGRFDVTKLEPVLADLHERLAGVVLEQLPYAEVIRRYDSPETLIYLDPPYVGCEEDYGVGTFSPADFAQLAEQLEGIEGRFILSINDTPLAREVFGRFELEEVETTWTISTAATGGGKKVGELIVKGGGTSP